MKLPPLRYADNEGVAIGYRTAGEGHDVVFTSGAAIAMDNMWLWTHPIAEFARITVYDKRGIGVSDGAANFSFEERTDDIRAVMDSSGIERAHLVGASEGGPQSVLFAATYPDRVRSLTIYGSYPSWMKRRDYPEGKDMTVSEYSRWVDRVVRAQSGVRADMEWFWDMWAPGLAATPGFFELMEGVKPSCGPQAQRLIWEAMYEADVRSLLPAIHVPTTIVHRRGDRVAPIEGARYLAAHINGAKLVELDGDDHFQIEPIPELIAAIREHVGAGIDRPNDRVDRRLATVLFTDIVDSTISASRHGDREWAAILERHDQAVRALVTSHGGRVVKTTGDGVLATFDGPSRAVECARRAHEATAEIGLEIRAGLHTGEIELRADDDVAGMAVHIAARVSGLANAGETIVSRTVKDLVVGSGFVFADAGEQTLKGVDDAWHCYRLTSSGFL